MLSFTSNAKKTELKSSKRSFKTQRSKCYGTFLTSEGQIHSILTSLHLSYDFKPFKYTTLASPGQVVIRRRPLFYTVNLLLPSIFLMVMDIVGFYLPPDSGERVSFKVTLLLGYSVFLIIVSDTLPATAIGTPLIGTWKLSR